MSAIVKRFTRGFQGCVTVLFSAIPNGVGAFPIA
jgi:hypothetical protein